MNVERWKEEGGEKKRGAERGKERPGRKQRGGKDMGSTNVFSYKL